MLPLIRTLWMLGELQRDIREVTPRNRFVDGAVLCRRIGPHRGGCEQYTGSYKETKDARGMSHEYELTEVNVGPCVAVFSRCHGRINERKAHAPVMHVGILGTITVPCFTSIEFTHVLLEFAMQACIRVMEGFNVTRWNGRLVEQPLRDFRKETIVAANRSTPVSAVRLIR